MIRRTFLLISLVAALVVGCSSHTMTYRAVEVKPPEKNIEARAVGNTPESMQMNKAAFDYYVDGLIADELRDFGMAANAYRSALHIAPESHEIRLSLANAYLHLRQWQKALQTLQNIEPETMQVLEIRAVCYRSNGISDLTRQTYLRMAELYPDDQRAYSYLGGAYQKMGLTDSTLWAYANLARLQPTNFRLHQEVGRLQAHVGRLDKAIESYRHSISVHAEAENILAYSGLSEIYLKQGQPDSAIAIAKAGLQIEPANILLNRMLTNIYVGIDSLLQAATHARRVVDAAPLDRFAARRLGSIYFALDSVVLADSVFTWLVASGERHAANHWFLGRIATRLEQPERAVEEYTHLAMLADTVAESWLDLGFAYRQLDSLDGEIKTYLSGLNSMVDEDSAIRLLFALGAAYERAGNIAKAVTTFEQIIEKRPGHDPSLNYLGYLLADRGERLEYAKDLIEKALAISTENAAYIDSYGWVLFRMGQYKKAVKHLKKAVSLDNDPVIFDHLGDAYQATGNLDKARKWWQKALDREPNNVVIQRKLGN